MCLAQSSSGWLEVPPIRRMSVSELLNVCSARHRHAVHGQSVDSPCAPSSSDGANVASGVAVSSTTAVSEGLPCGEWKARVGKRAHVASS